MKKVYDLISDVSNTSFLTFKLKEEKFAVNSDCISDILEVPSIIKLPGSPEYLRGVIIFSKVAVPLLDLRLVMQYPRSAINVNSNIILFKFYFKDQITFLGALIDSIEEIIDLDMSQVIQINSNQENLVTEVQELKYKFINPQKLISPEDFLMINKIITKASLNTKKGI